MPTAPAARPAPASVPHPVAAASQARTPAPASYAFDLKLDADRGALAGTGSVAVTNTGTEPMTELYFRLWGNTPALARNGAAASMTDVRVDGSAVEATTDRTVVKVPLAAPLAPGASANVDFRLDTKVPTTMGRTGTSRDGALYFGNALPTLAVHDEEGWNLDPYVSGGESFYTLASDWNVRVITPTDRQLITTGTIDHEESNGSLRATTLTAQNVRDFLVVAAPHDYKMIQQRVDGTNVRVWASPADASRAPEMLKTAATSLAWYNARYGTFNQPEYDVIATRGLGGGMEYPGITLNDTSGGSFGREVIAHETGHQWFYGMVGNNQWDEPWLDESFTSFITAEYLKQDPGKLAEMLKPGFDRRTALAPPVGPRPGAPITSGPVHVSSPMNVLSGRGYFNIIYGTGAKVLDQLKREMGEDRFVAGMREHVATQRNQSATTAGFMQTMNAAAGRDLTPWFNDHGVFASEPAADEHLDPNASF